MYVRNFSNPEEVRTPPKSKIEIVKVGESTIMKATFEPGWKWSDCMKPIAGTDSCQAHHINYVLSGKVKIVLDDGTELEVKAGDAADIPPGHDAWVVGDEPCVMIDFAAGGTFGKK